MCGEYRLHIPGSGSHYRRDIGKKSRQPSYGAGVVLLSIAFSVGAFADAPAGSILENMERAVFGSNKFQKRPVFFVGQQNYIYSRNLS